MTNFAEQYAVLERRLIWPRRLPSAWLGGLLLVLHLAAVCTLVPPQRLFSLRPVLSADFSVHIYHADFYRRAIYAGSLPWGYDPAVAAGKSLLPTQTVSSQSLEFFAVVAAWLKPQVIARVVLLFTALTFPLWTWWATRKIGLTADEQIWTLLCLLAGVWLYPSLNGFMRIGMVDFALSCFLAPLALALFLRFVERPTARAYLAFLLAVSVVFAVHILGVMVLIPPIAAYALFSKPLDRRYRLLAVSTPLWMTVLNGFWFIPFVRALAIPDLPGREFRHHPQDLVYGGVTEFLEVLSVSRIALAALGLALLGFGTWVLARRFGKRTAVAVGLAVVTGLILKFAGSSAPSLARMNPNRFLLPSAVFGAFPLGLAAHRFASRLRIPTGLSVPLIAAAAITAAFFAPQEKVRHSEQRFFGGQPRMLPSRFPLALPHSVQTVEALEPVLDFTTQRTGADDRLLVQTSGQCEQLLIPLLTGREVIGTTYTDEYDPAQFHYNRVFGRAIDAWKPAEMKETLARWGVDWAFALTPDAKLLLSEATASAGEEAGPYRVFRTSKETSKFLVGSGRVETELNRIELRKLEPAGDWIVLRYRYHPAWEASDPGTSIYRYPLPEDAVGFLAIRNPGREVVLHFRPWKMLSARWPAGRTVERSQIMPEEQRIPRG